MVSRLPLLEPPVNGRAKHLCAARRRLTFLRVTSCAFPLLCYCPMLQLLREASVSRAVAAFPDAQNIYRRNLETMRRLGASGWTDLVNNAIALKEHTDSQSQRSE